MKIVLSRVAIRLIAAALWVLGPREPVAGQPDFDCGDIVVVPVEMGPYDDPDDHVIAGDFLSPGQTEPMVGRVMN